MRIFLTGATGFVGSAIIPNLLKAGHQVVGLTRSKAGAKTLMEAGAEAYQGELQDLDSLRRAASSADGVIHAAFNHDFTQFAESCDMDRKAIEAIGAELKGSDRPFIVTAGLPMSQGRPTTEQDPIPLDGSMRVSEQAANSLIEQGLNVSVIRMSQIHDLDRQGMATYMIEHARKTGISAYIEEGENRWASIHKEDAAVIYALALEKGDAGSRYHAVSEEGIRVREVAEAIGLALNIPVKSMKIEEAREHFGWLAGPVSMNTQASSTLTQEKLTWLPNHYPDFISDLRNSSLLSI